uniref:RNA/RNP complex-1-interacting phosphatase n=1 Tax=Laticauda laticaudata TaxID=8630 RepID=A0A8C5SRD2_LATLA
MVKKNTIPDGWRNVSSVGQPIPGTRFIAFKVPLKLAINQRLTPTQRFTPKDLIAAVKAFNTELGLIIDLTYTTRYYGIKDLPKSMEYKKLFTIGLEVPDDPTILQFKKCVRKFLWENADNEKLIGVHCTNGINRTGYLICRYLIDVEGWDPETAIQAFGDARGHHIDGHIYLTDLKTQPMRSNLGMNMWDADGDIVPPPDDIDGHMDRFPNEEYPSRPGKRLRTYDDGPNDLPEQIRLREFDFINKGPGQRRKPYHDHQFHDDIQPPLPQIRQKHFPDHQFHDDRQEEMEIKDLTFSTRGPGPRFQPFESHQLDDDFLGNISGGDIDINCSQRHRHFADTPCYNHKPTDSQLNGGRGERRRPFYSRQSSDDFQSSLQDKNQLFLNKRPVERLRLFQNCPVHNDVHSPMGDFEYVTRGCGQRMVPFLDQQHHSELRRKLSLEDFDDEDSHRRSRPFLDNQSYCDFSEKSQLKDFQNWGSEQRLNYFNDHSTHINEPYEEYSERSHHFPSHEYYSESPIPQRDYGSDKDNYSRTCRSDCPDDYRKIHSSDVINRGGKARFAPYSSHPTLHSSSSNQELSSISLHSGREHQCELKREMSQGKRLPVVTIDYNYGLPLDYASEEEDRAHYVSHATQHYILK